ncbi:MAG: hypothetical protein AB7I50_14545 [Vicinamibacterales bacterium]
MSPQSVASQRGAVLLLVLLVVASLAATVAGLSVLVDTERTLTAVSRESAEYRYAAEGIAAFAAGDLAQRPDWSPVLSGGVASAFTDATRSPVLARPAGLDLDHRAAGFSSVETGAWGLDEPRWILYAWGPAQRLTPALEGTRTYVAAWVADDERDGDHDPQADVNGRLWIRAEAFGLVRGQRTVIVQIQRVAPAPKPLRILDWRFP